MHLQGLLDADQFLIFAQLEPPKGADPSAFLRHAELLRGKVHGVLVPEMSGGIMRMSSVSAASLLKQKGMEPIVHVHSRDRNRLSLQADLLGASALGVQNLLVSAGDDIKSGDHIEAKPVYDLDVIGVLGMIKKMQKGTDLTGNDLLGSPRFCVGAEVNAGLQRGALEVEVMEMEKKIKAGANYFFTSTMYDLAQFEQFVKKVAPFRVPVFAELTILKSVGMARFMARHVEGVTIPDVIFDRLGKAPDKIREGITIAQETIQELKGFCRGVLLVAIGDEERLSTVLDQAGL